MVLSSLTSIIVVISSLSGDFEKEIQRDLIVPLKTALRLGAFPLKYSLHSGSLSVVNYDVFKCKQKKNPSTSTWKHSEELGWSEDSTCGITWISNNIKTSNTFPTS